MNYSRTEEYMEAKAEKLKINSRESIQKVCALALEAWSGFHRDYKINLDIYTDSFGDSMLKIRTKWDLTVHDGDFLILDMGDLKAMSEEDFLERYEEL